MLEAELRRRVQGLVDGRGQLEQADLGAAHHIGSALEVLGSTFELVVVDAPHVLDDISLEIFDRSSTILLVTEPSLSSVRAARRAIDVFRRLNYLVTPERVRLVLNRYSPQDVVTVAQIEETLGMPVFAKVSNDWAAMSRAISLGKPACADKNDSRGARDIAALARQLVPIESANGANGADESGSERPAGPLRFLFGRSKS